MLSCVKTGHSRNNPVACFWCNDADICVHSRMESSKLALLLVFLACVEHCLSASCVVDSFTVKQDFDPKRVRVNGGTQTSTHVDKNTNDFKKEEKII